MSLIKSNLKYLNQTHLLRQAISICTEGQCSEADILHRLLLILDLFDVDLEVVKCDQTAQDPAPFADPMTWIHILAVGIVVSHAVAAILRQCKKVFTRRLPGMKLYSVIKRSIDMSKTNNILSY